jgi:hypothetical protein
MAWGRGDLLMKNKIYIILALGILGIAAPSHAEKFTGCNLSEPGCMERASREVDRQHDEAIRKGDEFDAKLKACLNDPINCKILQKTGTESLKILSAGYSAAEQGIKVATPHVKAGVRYVAKVSAPTREKIMREFQRQAKLALLAAKEEGKKFVSAQIEQMKKELLRKLDGEPVSAPSQTAKYQDYDNSYGLRPSRAAGVGHSTVRVPKKDE